MYTHSPPQLPFHSTWISPYSNNFFFLLLLGMGTTWRWRMDTRKTFNFLFMMKTIFACFSASLTIYHTLLKIYFSLGLLVPNKVTSPSAPIQYGSMRENTQHPIQPNTHSSREDDGKPNKVLWHRQYTAISIQCREKAERWRCNADGICCCVSVLSSIKTELKI